MIGAWLSGSFDMANAASSRISARSVCICCRCCSFGSLLWLCVRSCAIFFGYSLMHTSIYIYTHSRPNGTELHQHCHRFITYFACFCCCCWFVRTTILEGIIGRRSLQFYCVCNIHELHRELKSATAIGRSAIVYWIFTYIFMETFSDVNHASTKRPSNLR